LVFPNFSRDGATLVPANRRAHNLALRSATPCGDRRIRVTDFGLVRAADVSASTTGRFAGTPHFMSPEQCRGEPADERSDIYALAGTYFQLLTGRTPFTGPAPVQMMFAHCNAPVPDVRVHNPEPPEACAAIVAKAMAKLPADRF